MGSAMIGGVVILGIFWFVPALFIILPLILGLVALARVHRSQGRLRGKRLAMAAVVISMINLLGIPANFLLIMIPVASSGRAIKTSSTNLSSTTPQVPTPAEKDAGGEAGEGGSSGKAGVADE